MFAGTDRLDASTFIVLVVLCLSLHAMLPSGAMRAKVKSEGPAEKLNPKLISGAVCGLACGSGTCMTAYWNVPREYLSLADIDVIVWAMAPSGDGQHEKRPTPAARG